MGWRSRWPPRRPLRQMRSSSAIVCAESSNTAALSTYLAAGFTAREQVADLQRGT